MTGRDGGGFASIKYSLLSLLKSGRPVEMTRRMLSRNTCKNCALGMGGQSGGMRNEAGHFPEVCKKSFQAMKSDLAPPLAVDFFERHSLASLAAMSSRQLEAQGRLAFPALAAPGDTHYRRISWAGAFDHMAAAFGAARPQEMAFYSSGRSGNEAAFVLQLLARALGANNVNNCSFYCHQASGVGLSQALGTGTGTVSLEDLQHADFALVFGANPASNHPRLVSHLVALRQRGGRVVVVNPLREPGMVRFRLPSRPKSLLLGDDVCDLYIQPRVGGDIALIHGVIKVLLETGGVDETFVREKTEGFEGLRELVQSLDWPTLTQESGVDETTLRQLAAMVAQANAAVFLWAMGITHHAHGVDNVRAIVNLALVRGMAGKPHAGLMPIRGHSNVQGIGSMGVAPTLKQQTAEAMARLYGVNTPEAPGLDTWAMMQAAGRGELKTLLLLGGNLHGASPEPAGFEQAIRRVGLVVHLATKLNTGHGRGLGQATLLLPVLSREEEPMPTTQESTFSFVRLSSGGHRGPGEAKSEIEILATLAARLLPAGRVDWPGLADTRNVRRMIGQVVAGYEALPRLDEGGGEFQVSGRVLHEGVFPTATGKAQFAAVPLPRFENPPGTLRLMTLRSEGQFNTVVFEDEDRYRGMTRRDVILMHPQDAAALGLEQGDPVVVKSALGEMTGITVAFFDIARGCAAMYYPEANVLVPGHLDPDSRTPAFKHVPVWVSR